MTLHYNDLELKDDGVETDDQTNIVTKALSDFQKAFDDRLKAIETKGNNDNKLVDRLDKIEAKFNRPGATGANDDKLETKAFETFIRRGAERLSADEIKSMTMATDLAGGYLAPVEFGSEILKLLVQYSPIRQYAKVTSIGGSQIKYPRRTASTSATWVSDVADRTTSEPAYEQVSITPFELATYTDISTQLLEDNAYNLEDELASDFAESFSKTEGAGFVKGTGAGQPKGLLNAAGIAELKTGLAGGFPATNPADVIIGLFHALPNVHAQNGVWLMNRNTLGAIRTWKDTTGRYLIIDPISEGAPTTLLGRPVVEAVDFDDIGANKYPIMFGDLQGYRIIDRVGLSLLRDPYTLATKGQVRFHARKRVGAEITHPDRFVKLKVSV